MEDDSSEVEDDSSEMEDDSSEVEDDSSEAEDDSSEAENVTPEVEATFRARLSRILGGIWHLRLWYSGAKTRVKMESKLQEFKGFDGYISSPLLCFSPDLTVPQVCCSLIWAIHPEDESPLLSAKATNTGSTRGARSSRLQKLRGLSRARASRQRSSGALRRVCNSP